MKIKKDREFYRQIDIARALGCHVDKVEYWHNHHSIPDPDISENPPVWSIQRALQVIAIMKHNKTPSQFWANQNGCLTIKQIAQIVGIKYTLMTKFIREKKVTAPSEKRGGQLYFMDNLLPAIINEVKEVQSSKKDKGLYSIEDAALMIGMKRVPLLYHINKQHIEKPSHKLNEFSSVKYYNLKEVELMKKKLDAYKSHRRGKTQ